MGEIRIGLASQDKEYLKKILKALNEVKKKDRSGFYETYKAELIERINQKED